MGKQARAASPVGERGPSSPGRGVLIHSSAAALTWPPIAELRASWALYAMRVSRTSPEATKR